MQFPYSFGEIGFSGVKILVTLNPSGDGDVVLGVSVDGAGEAGISGVGEVNLATLSVSSNGSVNPPVDGVGDAILSLSLYATDARAIYGTANMLLVVDGGMVLPDGNASLTVGVNIGSNGWCPIIGALDMRVASQAVSAVGFIPVDGVASFTPPLRAEALGFSSVDGIGAARITVSVTASGDTPYVVTGVMDADIITPRVDAIGAFLFGVCDIAIPLPHVAATGTTAKMGEGNVIVVTPIVGGTGGFIARTSGDMEIVVPPVRISCNGEYLAEIIGEARIAISTQLDSMGYFPIQEASYVYSQRRDFRMTTLKANRNIYVVI